MVGGCLMADAAFFFSSVPSNFISIAVTTEKTALQR